MMRMAFGLLLALIVVAGAYVRLAPSKPDRWHVPPAGEADRDLKGGVLRLVETGPDGLSKLDAIARGTPRTRVLAGSVPEGMITYVTRTKVFGFPDYTTAQQDGETLRIYGRLRFGGSDFGVNKARVEGWLERVQEIE